MVKARSVRISEEAAHALDEHLERYGAARDTPLGRAGGEVRAALARLDRVSRSQPRRKSWRQLALARKARPSTRCRRCNQDFDGTGCTPEKCEFSPPATSRKPSKSEKREETAKLWRDAMARSGGECECKCGRRFQEEGDCKPELDHEASRRVPQTLQNVWMLAMVCHRQRQANRPSEAFWLGIYGIHCQRHGYAKEARRVEERLAVIGVKGSLPAAPNLNPKETGR